MTFTVSTKGHYDFINITPQLEQAVRDSGVQDGICVVFVPGSTAALTTMEYEEGVMEDLRRLFEQWAPEDADYEHHKKWGDHNGAAHMKHALLGPDLSIPIADGRLQLGTWQQAVLIDFDEKPRERDVIVKMISSA